MDYGFGSVVSALKFLLWVIGILIVAIVLYFVFSPDCETIIPGNTIEGTGAAVHVWGRDE